MPVSADQNTPGELPTPVLARSPDPVVARSPDRATDGIPDERPPVLARSPDRATDEQPTAEAQPDVAWSGDHATTDHATTDHATTDHATTDHATTDHATTDRATTEPAESPSDEKTPRGRRTILTPEKRRTILALLANGSSRRIAAQYADCSPSTIYRAAGRDPEFAAAVATAENNVEVELLRRLRKAAQTDRYWRAAAWLLERRNPRDFAQRLATGLTDQQMVRMFHIVASPFIEKMSDHDFDQSFQRLEEFLQHINDQPGSISTS